MSKSSAELKRFKKNSLDEILEVTETNLAPFYVRFPQNVNLVTSLNILCETVVKRPQIHHFFFPDIYTNSCKFKSIIQFKVKICQKRFMKKKI